MLSGILFNPFFPVCLCVTPARRLIITDWAGLSRFSPPGV